MPKQSAEMWFVYILRCADSTLYTGITQDLDRRTQQHNDGIASRSERGGTAFPMRR
jgi:predicted GIY-YIG superfamily endonuclease